MARASPRLYDMKILRRRREIEPARADDSYLPPTTAALLRAHATGGDIEAEVSGLARDYAEEGESLDAFLDDLEALLHGAELPPMTAPLVRLAATAWADGLSEKINAFSCADPLTGLATVNHLQSFLDGLFRARAGEVSVPTISDADADYAIVVVELGPRGVGESTRGLAKLAESLRIAIIAEEMRAGFASDEVLARLTDKRCAALVLQSDDLPMRTARLKRSIGQRFQLGPHGFVCKVWIENLPREETASRQLVAELCK